MSDETASARETVRFLLGSAARMRQIGKKISDVPDPQIQQVQGIADESEAEARRVAEEYGIDLSGLLQSN
jgi:hypothetical protein